MSKSRGSPSLVTNQNATKAPTMPAARIGTWSPEKAKPTSTSWERRNGCVRYSVAMVLAMITAAKGISVRTVGISQTVRSAARTPWR